ncbi:MAG: hypothetical protein H6605_06845 [Flavobacteriales bacterium]|nr:hypothetical protein [Flavobacteriales bacterium]
MKSKIFTLLFFCFTVSSMAQNKGVLSGNLQSSFNVFLVDSNIGVTESTSPQYGTQKSSAEAFLFLNYNNFGFDFAARFDMFNNSNLLNPTGSYSDQGLGFWQISKEIEKLKITAGYFYEQFGSGIVFRSYEDRLIGIDYAIQGLKARYRINDNLAVKAFTGRQKGFQENRFGFANQIVKGFNIEGKKTIKKVNLDGGASIVNRTLDNQSMASIVSEINNLPNVEDRFYPKYNTYSYNGYLNSSYKYFTLGLEYVGKTKEAIRDQITGDLKNKAGEVIIANFGFSKSKLGKKKKGGYGLNFQYRRIDSYNMTLSPNVRALEGLVGFVPSLTQQSSYRLLARYAAQAITTGEEGLQMDMNIVLDKKNTITINLADIKQLNGEQLYREYYIDYLRKFSLKLKTRIGVQSIFYDQQIYQGKLGHADVKTITPFFDITYKPDRKNSFRFEGQYMKTEQDYGSFANILIEWNHSPHFSFQVSDMINTEPHRYEDNPAPDKILHYYSIFGKYIVNTTSFTLAYIKQVEGINCSGGVCRLEPAFSGVRFTLTTNF